jgi:hypothetical protein
VVSTVAFKFNWRRYTVAIKKLHAQGKALQLDTSCTRY